MVRHNWGELSEPHINSTAVRELYIILFLWYVGHVKYAQHGSMGIDAK